MLSAQPMVSAAAIMLLAAVMPARSQTDAREDLAPCHGSAAEPAQSAAWNVAFCNRTGHDLVVEFRDNDCPLQGWSRRGDIYRRSLRRGESATFSLCYAVEPAQANPGPGVPTLRIPGGKGIVTTWTVVGDCGERSDRLNLDARTFYDRGDYKSGIILLQYPSGAAHCVADSSNAARPQAQPAADERSGARAAVSPVAGSAGLPAAAQSPPATPMPSATTAPSATAAPSATTAPSATAAPSAAPTGNPPSFSVVKDAKDTFGRTVHIFATSERGAPDYRCRFTLALGFTDGADFIDHPQSDVPGGQDNALVLTKKYGKTVAKVQLSSSKCSVR